MGVTDDRYGRWLTVLAHIVDLSRSSKPTDPYRLVGLTLNETFQGRASSWNVIDQSFTVRVAATWPDEGTNEDLPPPPQPPSGRWQPLVRWHARTGLWTPQRLGAVPAAVVEPGLVTAWRKLAAPAGIEHLLSIPVDIPGAWRSAFVVGRSARDFDDRDVKLARTLQPLLTLALKRYEPPDSSPHREAKGLTSRERMVLDLAGQGLSDRQIARRLEISTRTVQKHLEHAFRKLGVSDRLTAHLTARRCGFLNDLPIGDDGAPGTGRHPPTLTRSPLSCPEA